MESSGSYINQHDVCDTRFLRFAYSILLRFSLNWQSHKYFDSRHPLIQANDKNLVHFQAHHCVAIVYWYHHDPGLCYFYQLSTRFANNEYFAKMLTYQIDFSPNYHIVSPIVPRKRPTRWALMSIQPQQELYSKCRLW